MSARKSSEGRLESPSLELYGWALEAPSDQERARLIELDAKWDLSDVPQENHLVVGRRPLRSVKPMSAALSNALRRSAFPSSWRKRSPGHRLVGSQKLPPPPGASGPGGKVRDWLLSGALYRLSTDGPFETLFDVVRRAAGVKEGASSFHASGDGSIVARFTDAEGRRAILRAARRGIASDPSEIADALEHLQANDIEHVPRPLGRGVVDGVSWMTESFLSGTTATGLDASLQEQAVAFCSQLPSNEEPPSAAAQELAFVAESLPEHAAKIRGVSSRIVDVVGRLPGVTRHGDFWAGNLLVDKGRLVGVIDWAAWHDSAVPGTDLLHLWAAEKKKGGRGELGETWKARPWTDADWLRITAPYWEKLNVDPNEEVLEAVSIAWWATWVVQSLARYPARGENARWVRGNVDAVLDSLA